MVEVSGGDKLRDKLQGIGRQITNASDVKVGFLAGATYPDGTPVALAAAITEFGRPSIGQPPRPAFRNMIAAKKGEWPASIAGLLKDNNYDALRTLQQTGEAVAGQLRQSITDITGPPLKPATIKRKGFDKVWIDTGVALQSVSYEVKS
jgi:hypothetical protein